MYAPVSGCLPHLLQRGALQRDIARGAGLFPDDSERATGAGGKGELIGAVVLLAAGIAERGADKWRSRAVGQRGSQLAGGVPAADVHHERTHRGPGWDCDLEAVIDSGDEDAT